MTAGHRPRHATLVGATASGKSAVAVELARRLGDVEIVSIDAMGVYRGMDVGTAKPPAAVRAEIPHHLVDVVDPTEEHSAAMVARAVPTIVAGIEARNHRALLVGGTGLYLRAAIGDLEIPGRYPTVVAELDGEPDTEVLHRRLVELDPVAAARMEPTNRRRVLRALEVTIGSGRRFSDHGPGLTTYPPSPYLLLGLRLPRPVLDQRIAERFDHQLAAGFVDEVRELAARPAGLSATAAQALGYRELLAHVEGGVPLDEAVATAVARTRRFARRQERWFRRDPRIEWLEPTAATDHDPLEVVPQALAVLADAAAE